MQSAMQKKLNAQAHEFEAKLESKSQELAQAKAEATSLKAKVDKAEGELSEMASALEASRNALAELNASVNEPGQAKDWRQLKGKAFWAWLKENNVR